MKLTLDEFFTKHSHLKRTAVAREAGIAYQRLTEVSAGDRALTADMAVKLNGAIERLTSRQIKDRIITQQART